MEYDLAVIGSGPGGYVAAIRAAQLGLSTVCIEKDSTFGGTCLNVGCIPSKALLHSSHFYEQIERQAKENGIIVPDLSIDLLQMMSRKEKIVDSFTKGIAYLFKRYKIDSKEGFASFLDPHTVSVKKDGKEERVTAKNFILATGSIPISLPFLPFDEKEIVSSTGALSFDTIPEELLIIGAGIIGIELGSVWGRLGAKVSVVEMLPRIAPGLDKEIANALQKTLSNQMQFFLSHRVKQAEKKRGKIELILAEGEAEKRISGDRVLVAIGRKPFSEGLHLEKIGVEKDERGFVVIDHSFRTHQNHIYAIGDLVEGPMLAHKAQEEGLIVAEHLAGKESLISYITIPNVAYTHPEAASVGLTEEKIKDLQIDYLSAKVPFKSNSRGKCIDETEGFVKVLARRDSKELLGMHILSAGASDLIMEGVFAMKNRLTADEIAKTPHAHPTLSESVKEACMAISSQAIHL